jgi:hypothetical protein
MFKHIFGYRNLYISSLSLLRKEQVVHVENVLYLISFLPCKPAVELVTCSGSAHKNTICKVTKISQREYFKYTVMYLAKLLFDLFMLVCVNKVS